MTRKDIITLPNPRLRQRSHKVDLADTQIRQLVADMEAATLDWEDHRQHEVGVALAAIQLGKKQRILIIRNNFEDRADRTFQALINPQITKHSGDMVEDYEGCLSIKDIYGKVPRYDKVVVVAENIDGDSLSIEAEGFLARVLQHEIDHTRGKLFIDHIRTKEDAFYSLNKEGKLIPLDYEKQVKKNNILWK